jgi:hypothetical protein
MPYAPSGSNRNKPFTLHIPPELHTLLCTNFFNPSKKDSFGCAANRKIGNRKSEKHISPPAYKRSPNSQTICVCVFRRVSVSECPLQSLPSRRGVTSSSQNPSSHWRRGPISKRVNVSEREQKLGHEFRQGSKPKIAMLARASSNLPLCCAVFICLPVLHKQNTPYCRYR